MKITIQSVRFLRGFGAVLFIVIAASANDCLAESTVPTSYAEFSKTGNSGFDSTVKRYLDNEAKKIIGGEPAPEGRYPWQVSLGVSWITDPAKAHFCGGSIVNEKWIRTAAHCVEGVQSNDVLVAFGTNKLVNGIKRLGVELMFFHKNYNQPKDHDNDVALVKLAEPLAFGDKTKPIKLASKNHNIDKKSTLYVSGWGATKEGGAGVDDLRHVSVPFVNNDICNDPLSYDGEITDNMLCAGKASGGKDSCQGDSGGPLMDLSNGTVVQIGIVSWGEGCGQSGKYGVYADSRRYDEWEKQCIEKPEICL